MTVRMTKEAIERALNVLVGKAMTGSSRAVDMEMFHFGDQVEFTDGRGRVLVGSEYGLHVQAPWRIERFGRLVVGYRDMRDPPSGVDLSGFDPNDAPLTRRDELIEAFHAKRRDRPRLVVRCDARSAGGVRLTFDDASVLEIFPDSAAADDEYWRLLGPDEEHTVATGAGLLRPGPRSQ